MNPTRIALSINFGIIFGKQGGHMFIITGLKQLKFS